ncbi:hypothetical protein BCAR13_850051 [Paraburkholderia caribensis]|nr:hypothetical protein BCAR13_850051 [Paraburkholderia caribensis]
MLAVNVAAHISAYLPGYFSRRYLPFFADFFIPSYVVFVLPEPSLTHERALSRRSPLSA